MEVIQEATVTHKDYSSIQEYTTAQRGEVAEHCKYCIRTHSDYCN